MLPLRLISITTMPATVHSEVGVLIEWGTLDWGPDVLAVKTGRGLKMALSFSISNLVRI